MTNFRTTVLAVVACVTTIACASTISSSSSVQTRPTDTGSTEINPSRRGTLPVGQELDVRLQNSLSSDTAQPEDRFQATTIVDLTQDERVLVPAGSIVEGVVAGVESAGRLERKGRLTLAFERIRVRDRTYDVRATATEVFESEGIESEAAKIGTAAGVGAIVGGILGGVKGALTGVLVGAGGMIAATEGNDVELPAGTIVRIRFDAPVNVTG